MRLVNGLLVDPAGLDALAAVERRAHELCGGEVPEPEEVVLESKRYAVEELLAPELERVVDLALRVAETRPLHRDHPRVDIRRAIAALAVGFEVYRTYVVPGADGASSRSEEHTSELQSLMRISYAVFCLQKKKQDHIE